MLYAKLIGRIALFTCENIAHIEFHLQGLLPKILAIYTITEDSGVYTSPLLYTNKLKMALRARKVFGAFEKRAPGRKKAGR